MALLNFINSSSPRSWIIRVILALIFILSAVAFIYRSCNVFLADRIVRSEQSIESYSRALRYDPSNASLWWQRGRLHYYSIQDINISEAISDYEQALELNPRLSGAWMDISDAFEQTGKFLQAEEALEQAFKIQPYSPMIRWKAGNFFLRRGNLTKMYECFEITCRYDATKLGIAIETAWKIDPAHEEILHKLIPDDFQSNLRYLRFLVGKNELDLASAAWQRCLKNTIPPDYNFKPSALFGYINRLLLKNRISEALQAWDSVLQKALTGLSDLRNEEYRSAGEKSEAPNLIWNGSFENELLNGGFGWRYPDIQNIRFQIDIATRFKQLKSLKVTFEGFNITTGHLYQIVPVFAPGNYVLDFYVKTDDLSTDQRPYFSITGYPDAKGASGISKQFNATTDWIKKSVPFTVAPNCNAVQLSLHRDKSMKLDNQIKGTVWLDGFVIHR